MLVRAASLRPLLNGCEPAWTLLLQLLLLLKGILHSHSSDHRSLRCRVWESAMLWRCRCGAVYTCTGG